jgi:hypothetical protein
LTRRWMIYMDKNGDPAIVLVSHPLTDVVFDSHDAALEFIYTDHPELIVDVRAARWWRNTNLCFSDEPSRPELKLADYRADQGGIEALCEVADVCPLLNEERICHGVVWCPVYNLGWGGSHGCNRGEYDRDERREIQLEMIAEAERARRYEKKGIWKSI